MIAKTPQPPYYAVIFTSIQTQNLENYEQTSGRMLELVATMPGFLGFESAHETIGITVSYWENLESIRHWKYQMEHIEARDKGREQWYKSFKTRICKVERDYGFEKV